MKKHLKRILPIVAVLILLVMAVSLFGCQQPEAQQPAQEDIKVYWNVDRNAYWDAENRTTVRMKAGDRYRVRLAVDGEQVDLFVDNYEIMNQIDSQKFMGLRINEENVVTQVLKPHEFTGGLAVYDYYVIEVQENLLICNNLSSGKGLPLKLKINENTKVYNVGGEGLLVGLPGQLEAGSRVYGVMGLDGYVSHLFTMPPFEPEPVYWNVERQYNSSAKVSTRERDVTGYFSILFAVDGEQVTLRTQSTDVVNQIDSFAAKCMHLEFDEAGNIIEATHAKNSTGGNSIASWYDVMRIDSVENPGSIEVVANGFYAEKFSGGKKTDSVECTFSSKVKIYDVSVKGENCGKPTQLRLYDRVHCLTDAFGDVCIVFVVSRSENVDLYYNVERMWDSKTSTSTRSMGADGYYHFEMSTGGKLVKLKTKDVDVVNTIDGRGAKVLGLKLEGDVIIAAYAPSSVFGSTITVFDYCEVTQIGQDGTVTCIRDGKTFQGVVTPDTKIYNVSGTAKQKGEPTTIKVGDKLYGFRGFEGGVTTVYVVSRQVPGPVYWNLDRSYDSTNKVTKRKPAEDGYYYFQLAAGTKTATYKTKSKELANTLDSYVAVALSLNGDVITNVYKYDQVKGYTGGGFASWCDVQSISGKTVTAADSKATHTGTMAPGCVIYDVSQGSAAPVTKTQLQRGDRIHGIKNADGQITVIYVVNRIVKLDLYYNISRKWDNDKAITTRVADEEGWYWFDMAVNGQQVRLKTDNIELVNAIDGRAAKVMGLKLDGDVITAAYKPGAVSGSEKTVFDYATVTAIAADGTITATRDGKTYTGKPADSCKTYNVSSTAAQTGELSTVKVGDTVYGLGDSKGQLNHIYITSRQVNVALYYNITRKWDGEKAVSTRTADEDGWYWFDMVLDGTQVKLKTKDTKVVDTIDGRAAKVLGLEVEGDVIAAAYKPSAVVGSEKTVFDYATVTAIAADGTITTTRDGKTYTGKPADSCKTYNVSTTAAQVGELSAVKVGDTLYGLGDSKGQLTHIYITSRQVNAPLYYNMTRKWDSKNAVSIRTADADGWYWFDMVLDGTQVQLKTKDTKVVHTIDGRAAKVLGLEVENGVILAAYKPSDVPGSEKTIFDFADVTAIASDGTITAVKNEKTVTGKLAQGCKVYNMSSVAAQLGETTMVQVGDQIYALGADSQLANYVFVINRTVKTETRTALCTVCNETVTWNAWDGAASLKDSTHWYLTENVSVKATAQINGNTQACMDLCGYEISGAQTLDRIFNIYGTFNLMDTAGTGKVVANYSNEAGRTGSVFYVQSAKTNGYGVFKLYGGTLTSTGITKNGGIGGVSNDFYMYGGTITGGHAANNGGNLFMEPNQDSMIAIYGGQITDGTADGLGGGIFANRNISLGLKANVSGNNGSDVYLRSGYSLLLDQNQPLDSQASIGVTLENTYGTVAEGAVEADLERIFSNEQKQITYAEGQLTIALPEAAHTDHCVCGGLGQVGDHTCDPENVPVWEPWTGSWESGKYYYLTVDTELAAAIEIAEGKTLNLCLNGFTITNSATDRIFNIYGTMNLCDHKNHQGQYEGQAISQYTGTSTRTGRVFYVQNKATFNLYGGNLISGSATQKGAVGGTAKTFNMYDGTISGGKATVCGGNIQIDGGTTTIYGGTVTGGKSVNGGNIYVNGGSLVVLGGQITGGEAQEQGGGIYSKKDVTVGGAVQITGNTGTNLYLTENVYVNLSADHAWAEDAVVGLTIASTNGVFCKNATETDADHFVADNGQVTTYADGTLSIGEISVHADHCICGGLGQVGDHTCTTEHPQWEPWTGTWESGKYYYLNNLFTVNQTIKIEEGQTLNLCLNGFDLEGSATVTRIFDIYGKLNLCDHADEEGNYSGDVISNYNTDVETPNTKSGRVFYIQNKTDAQFNMYGGNLLSNSSTTNGGIGGIERSFNMYAGSISGGKATGNGGNLILVLRSAAANLYGGTVADGDSANGANIHVDAGSLTLDGVTVSGGNASNAGGSIRVNANGSLNMKSGTLTGGYAKGNGGNVYSQGSIVITGGMVSNGQVASTKIGGNLYASGGSLSISDDPEIEGKPSVTGGQATYGGNIAVKIDGVSITGCTVSGGTADYGADIYFEKSGGTLSVSGCGPVTVYAKTGTVSGDSDVTVTKP